VKPVLRHAAAFLAAAVIGHVGTIVAAPHAIMHVAMDRLSESGRLINAFRFSDRTTSASRWVVRPSPDLAYASCVYDLSQGPILVDVPPSQDGGYVSVSVFAGNTDNVAVMDSIRSPKGIRFILQQQGKHVHPGPDAVVYTPSQRGIILDRRLAPTAAAFAKVDEARRADRCAPLG
jgi:uncharacterized membrane protein